MFYLQSRNIVENALQSRIGDSCSSLSNSLSRNLRMKGKVVYINKVFSPRNTMINSFFL